MVNTTKKAGMLQRGDRFIFDDRGSVAQVARFGLPFICDGTCIVSCVGWLYPLRMPENANVTIVHENEQPV